MSFMQTPQLLSPYEASHIRALDIDEILIEILKHVLLPSAECLLSFKDISGHNISPCKPSHTPMLVCRRWYSIGCQVALTRARLDPDIWHFDRPWFPNPLAHVSLLHYTFCSSSFDGWQELSNLLSGLKTADSANVFAPKYTRLRELWLSKIPCDKVYSFYLRALSQHSRITLVGASADTGFAGRRFCWDPLLSALACSSSLDPPHLRHLLLDGGLINQLPDTWSLKTSIRLSTLSLCQVQGDSKMLRALLLGVASPSLEQLSVTRSYIAFEEVFTRDFLVEWALLCCNLRRLHLDGDYVLPSVFIALVDHFPLIDRMECTHHCLYLIYTMAISHQLTRLEIASSKKGALYLTAHLPNDIQRFLCSHAAAQLREVIIPDFHFDPNDLDSSAYTFTTAVGLGRSPRWSCSSLSTLVISIGTRITYLDNCVRSVAESRVAYGFITASCPALESLDIRFDVANFDLDPEGGLCFLGRLPKLKHLTIRARGYRRYTKRQRAPWPYDTPIDDALVHWSLRTRVSYRLGKNPILVPVLRWLAVAPTEIDRERNMTNLCRCDYVLNAVVKEDCFRRQYSSPPPVPSQWRLQLQAVLTEARNQMDQGSMWQQLQTFHCHLDTSSLPGCSSVDDKMQMAFVKTYQKALKQVLPHVDVAVYPSDQACW